MRRILLAGLFFVTLVGPASAFVETYTYTGNFGSSYDPSAGEFTEVLYYDTVLGMGVGATLSVDFGLGEPTSNTTNSAYWQVDQVQYFYDPTGQLDGETYDDETGWLSFSSDHTGSIGYTIDEGYNSICCGGHDAIRGDSPTTLLDHSRHHSRYP